MKLARDERSASAKDMTDAIIGVTENQTVVERATMILTILIPHQVMLTTSRDVPTATADVPALLVDVIDETAVSVLAPAIDMTGTASVSVLDPAMDMISEATILLIRAETETDIAGATTETGSRAPVPRTSRAVTERTTASEIGTDVMSTTTATYGLIPLLAHFLSILSPPNLQNA